jgi:hypothetical protein
MSLPCYEADDPLFKSDDDSPGVSFECGLN